MGKKLEELLDHYIKFGRYPNETASAPVLLFTQGVDYMSFLNAHEIRELIPKVTQIIETKLGVNISNQEVEEIISKNFMCIGDDEALLALGEMLGATAKEWHTITETVIKEINEYPAVWEMNIDLFNRINSIRQKFGIVPLKKDDPRVIEAIRKHYDDCVNGYCDDENDYQKYAEKVIEDFGFHSDFFPPLEDETAGEAMAALRSCAAQKITHLPPADSYQKIYDRIKDHKFSDK